MAGTPKPTTVSTRLQRIAELARKMPDASLRTLAHHIDVQFLREAHGRTRKDGASGVDGQTADDYARNLESNLEELLNRFKTGTYRAPPVRRVHIPKGDGKTRPLGIPTFEDKVLQRAVHMVLEAVYEQDFLDCSYGFRPGRSAHQALDSLWQALSGGGWVIDADIQGFFDNLDHAVLKDFLVKRVSDGVIRRTVHKWLKAGVMEEGERKSTSAGTPQGGVISPLLANVYLHEVLDTWFELEIRPRLKGEAHLVRYADDFVMVFESEEDARRVLNVLPKRFGKYGLSLHPEKTRLVHFKKPPRKERGGGEGTGPGTFDFLGFTHYWGRSRSGNPVVKRRTATKNFTRSLRKVAEWCRKHRHMGVLAQALSLRPKLQGHYGYYGITGNFKALDQFAYQVRRTWRKWLARRSQRARMDWERFNRLLEQYPLPPPRVVHSVYRR